MLTTIIYRSHICEDVPVKALEEMVAAANRKNRHSDVTGILLFNGTHFFQLLEGPVDNVTAIYQHICRDPRHHNVVELMCDHGPFRRFGNVGMELFDLRQFDTDEVLQQVLDKGTTKYRLTYSDRALQFFRTFVEATEKANYFELPPANSWEFISEETPLSAQSEVVAKGADCSFAFQPIVDPFMQQIVSWEALIRTPEGDSPAAYFQTLPQDALYEADLKSKQVALSMASALGLHTQTLSLNLLPMTLVNVPNAVDFLLTVIEANGFVPEQIVVEFTESEAISRFDEFTHSVRQLKSAGISVTIDHFGAGFAGLQLLAQFQPDRIKINRDLIANVHKSGPRQAIVQAIIKCCASLEIQFCAVGVELAEEWMWLESAGISQFQGHLFASPRLGGIPAVAWPEKKNDF
ncbi:diguanylate phosphodiesterase [Enterobacter mori]|jgi:EAL domain-containing protein (putative c-di-GMP-specific phosphodiesterase class I)|uniref:diguanylate phosphodiesterase n=1 Tax=Enterobacter mori TaxID=539813 RepID=UPI001BDFACA9|nr:diguanylate phosphodiesterase [Enterobacter mori]MBT2103344.1 diguanylate phosphodiesterase [Enterobacter mori]MCW4985831.1 diguanylate phosphodiesterase [Enterobacter mori]MDF2527000.1 diguanylate phosphodiesterase [Enterobacter mori]MEB7566704.1 diguanylate phosphodiesterase [Enterobacter mori]UCT06891.1 diguanylate phosphodiesterase [Enterobacter mori]